MEPEDADLACCADSLPQPLLTQILELAIEGGELSSLCCFAAVSRSWRRCALEMLSRLATLDLRYGREGSPRLGLCNALPLLLWRCHALRKVEARHEYVPSSDDQEVRGGLLRALVQCPGLDTLVLNFTPTARVLTDGLGHFARACAEQGAPRLRRLELMGCTEHVGNGEFVVHLAHLEHLNVAFCRRFNPPRGWLLGGANGLPPRSAPLKVLDLRMCDTLDLEELKDRPEACGLEQLNLGFVAEADDGVLLAVGGMPRLRHLLLAAPTDNLWSHGAWSQGGLEELARRRPDLRVELRYV